VQVAHARGPDGVSAPAEPVGERSDLFAPPELENEAAQPRTLEPQLVPLAEFVANQEERAPALLGDDDDTFLARGGLGITGGVGGSTKTTLMIDAVTHLAA